MDDDVKRSLHAASLTRRLMHAYHALLLAKVPLEDAAVCKDAVDFVAEEQQKCSKAFEKIRFLESALFKESARVVLLENTRITASREARAIAQDGSISVDWLAEILADDARVEDGRLVNAEYLAARIAEFSDKTIATARREAREEAAKEIECNCAGRSQIASLPPNGGERWRLCPEANCRAIWAADIRALNEKERK